MKRTSWGPWSERQGEDATGASGHWPVPDGENGDDAAGDGSFWQAMAVLTSLGWVLALPVAAGVLLGAWLDRRLGTGPALTLGLLGVGIVVAGLEAYLMIVGAHGEGRRP